MFEERKLIEAIALTRLFEIKELALDSTFVNSEKGEKNLHEYQERVIDLAITIALSNRLDIEGSQIDAIIKKVFADVIGKEI